MSTPVAEKRTVSTPTKRREWAPRIWEGCDFFAWMRLLITNRFAVHPSCWHIACIVTVVSSLHTIGRIIQSLLYRKKVAATPITHQPIFIIGHWRTGTTLLHEFLIQDERFSYPNTYECLEPNHFLLTESIAKRWLWFLIPTNRPMDNMKVGWDRPQEDEFALCMMGQPSPYLTIAFPNRGPQYQEYYDLERVSPEALSEWKRALYSFMQHLTFKSPKRLVLKSPPHTCRIKVLLEMFPDARFVHIMRDPFVVFPSTVHLWKSLYTKHGMQRPTFAGLEEQVFETFNLFYNKLEEGRKLVKPTRFYELHYEDLVRDPVAQLRQLYNQLELDGFDDFLPNLEKYLEETKGYETNRYQITPEQREEIARRWGPVIQRYGYASPSEKQP